jgi:hypothetical protein
MEGASKKTILRIELWHGLMLLTLLFALGPQRWIEPAALLMGGLFMGINFLLLSYGIAWVLAPLAGRGKVKLGVSFLVLKILIFLGLLTTVFFKFHIDAISFAVGFSTLILAIFIEALWLKFKSGI